MLPNLIVVNVLQYLCLSTLNIHWRDWCQRWSSNTLAMWREEPTHWKRPWWWERLRAGGEGGGRGWDGWMASLTQWTWVWAGSGRWWRTGKPGMLQSMGSQRIGHDWVTELNWTEGNPVGLLCQVACRFYGNMISFWVVIGSSFWFRVLLSGTRISQPRWISASRILACW